MAEPSLALRDLRCVAEPSLALRARRGGVAAGDASGVGAAAWLAEPSLAERVRRTGRSPVVRAV
ncbi:hypothetical protein, partial [Streptomyces sp. CC77]|uniref:hypothetical protein n=1 Tax=Streptomyces sp. CC77 TaxID=1906739 RepID=UPI001C316D7C